jgi:DNA-directed RNA polymerase I subunit RPA49
MIARNQLGEAFGSKKRKIQIKQIEQNKVDVDSVEKVAGALSQSIQSSAASRITKEQVEDMVNKERPIPPFNINATIPAQVYNMDDIAPKSEVKTISIKDFMNVKIKSDLKKAADKIQYVFYLH